MDWTFSQCGKQFMLIAMLKTVGLTAECVQESDTKSHGWWWAQAGYGDREGGKRQSSVIEIMWTMRNKSSWLTGRRNSPRTAGIHCQKIQIQKKKSQDLWRNMNMWLVPGIECDVSPMALHSGGGTVKWVDTDLLPDPGKRNTITSKARPSPAMEAPGLYCRTCI